VSRTISVDEITRVEGHGGIDVTLQGRRVKDVRFNIFEGPRFFESFIKTMDYEKIPDITRRICAICTASHSLASIGAIEKAFNVEVTPQTKTLRDLLIHGEAIESHALHVFMLALPDFLGFPDAASMASKHLDAVKMALNLKKAGNMIHSTISGRDIHGMNERVGGFSKTPSSVDLRKIMRTMMDVKPATELAVSLLSTMELPQHNESDNNLMALDTGKRFGYLGDNIVTSTGERVPVIEYERLTNERTVKHSYAKFSSYNGKPFMVGALPRITLNGGKLVGTANDLYKEIKDKIDPRNSMSNNLCQALELVHDVERVITDIDELLNEGIENEGVTEFDVQEGRGVNAVEAPRGILYHDYSFDSDGRIIKANIITPTAQNAANIEKDIGVIAKNMSKSDELDLKQALEVMVRAYDPCISCSVHVTYIE
jgi:sulfhydrogenase subunit alpha